MSFSKILSIVIGLGSLVGVVIATMLAFRLPHTSSRHGSNTRHHLYEDQDGIAKCSPEKLSDKLPRVSANVLAITGFMIAFGSTFRVALIQHIGEGLSMNVVLCAVAWVGH